MARSRTRLAVIASAAAIAATVASGFPSTAGAQGHDQQSTATPIEHLVVIFQENVSFDHYFATYPNAANPAGEPTFRATPHTPAVNGLTPALLTHNPNTANPTRLDRSEALTCDQDHDYTPEQKAFNGGKMDKFVENTQTASCSSPDISKPGLVMDYYGGNTVTALWNYAQHFAMSDNSYGTVFGPSTPGALNLVSGQTHGATPTSATNRVAGGTLIGDLDPTFDDCSPGTTVAMSGPNVGDLLTAKRVTTARTTSRFSITPPLPTCTTCRRPPQPPSGTPTRPTTSTIWPISPPRCRATTCLQCHSSRPPSTRTATPATPTRLMSSASSSTPSTPCRSPRTGAPPPPSSPTTTPTAGTTTSAARSSTPASRRRTR